MKHKKELEINLDFAWQYFRNNKPELSEPLAKKILLTDPGNSQALEILAYIKGNQGKQKESHALLIKACENINCSAVALYYLGESYIKLGNWNEAIKKLELAQEKGGLFFESMFNLGLAQAQLGLNNEALISYEKSITYNRDTHIILLNIGKLHAKKGNLEEALNTLEKSIKISPFYIESWIYKAEVLYDLKRYQEALAYYEKITQIEPDNIIAWLNKAHTLCLLGRPKESLSQLNKLIEIQPNLGKAWIERGLVYFQIENYEEAIKQYSQALIIDPNSIDANINMGVALNKINRHDESSRFFEKAIRINPSSEVAWCNNGVNLYKKKEYKKAIESLDYAININSRYSEAWFNKGSILNELTHYEEAFVCLDKAIQIEPEYADAHFNQAYVLFRKGEFFKGWNKYEWRWKTQKQINTCPTLKKPKWKGEKKEGTLFIWAEQGIGDQILFSSVFNELEKYPQKKIISLDRKLIELFSRSFPNFIFIDRTLPLNDQDYDEQIPIGDVPKFFRKSCFDFKKTKHPYLVTDDKKNNKYTEIIGISTEKILCGLALKSHSQEYGVIKSIPLDCMNLIFKSNKIDFIDLQYKKNNEILNTIDNIKIKLKSLPDIDLYNDIDSLASVIDACEVIITCSNSIAHLAGALNKKTLLLLPQNMATLWYWQTFNGENLWYPSIKIFKQEQDCSWVAPVKALQNYLESLVN